MRHLFKIIYCSFICLITISCGGNSDEDAFIDIKDKDTNYHLGLNKDTLFVAHWNIGHFSLGRSSGTAITEDISDMKALSYREMIDTLKVDLFGICEYNVTFDTTGNNTHDLILYEFPFYAIGMRHAYNCNAIFFKFQDIITTVSYYRSSIQIRYYICSTFIYNNIEVKFVETHLDWNQGEYGNLCRNDQMRELASTFRNDPYVIICADFNTSNPEEYKCFLDDGFSIAFDEHTSKETFTTIDNVIYKGFRLVDKSIIKDNTLSDHSLLKAAFMLN